MLRTDGSGVAFRVGDKTNEFRSAAWAYPGGSQERIPCVGQVDLIFAIGEPTLFQMMFSQKPNMSEDDIVTTHGKAYFAHVLRQVEDDCKPRRVKDDARMIAVQHWTLVHGASSLVIDDDYAKVASQIDAPRMIASGAERLLFLLPQSPIRKTGDGHAFADPRRRGIPLRGVRQFPLALLGQPL